MFYISGIATIVGYFMKSKALTVLGLLGLVYLLGSSLPVYVNLIIAALIIMALFKK